MSEALFGEFFKRKRLERGLGLREFCVKYGYNAGNISKLERGVLSPPRSEKKLRQYAKGLGLTEGTAEWGTFFDLAAVASGRIPQNVLSEREIAGRLPLIFRKLRGERLSDADLDSLIEKIRRS